MFIGHFAVGFGAKKLAPSVSLGTLFLASELADLLWPSFVLLGLERVGIRPGLTAVTPLDFVSYPFSHSLLALALWAAVLAAVHRLVRRPAAAVTFVLAGIVLSHWLLDVASHRPDMPITLSDPLRLGLGLWRSRPATIAVEGGLFAAGVLVYAQVTRPLDRTGRITLWALVGFLVLLYLASLFGPPPPSVAAVAWSGEAIWLLVAWGAWVDRHRTAVDGPLRSSSAAPRQGLGRHPPPSSS